MGDIMSIVECKGVKKTYVKGHVSVPALRGVNLQVEKGEFIALAGPSGSGKTTLLNLIGGLDEITEGTISVDDHKINGLNQSELADLRLRKIGFVFQSYNLVPVLTALENVEFVMMLQGVPPAERKEKSIAILKDVGLEEMINRRPTDMSGGQQQRVAVARAIISNPSIVLADEPTANLDSTTSETLIDIMKELNQKKNITFIFSTHDKLVMKHAQRNIHLRDGKIVDETVKNNRLC